MIAASLLVVGVLVALRAKLPSWAGMAIVGGFAVFHGYAHGVELPGTAAALPAVLAYVGGFAVATMALHLLGIVAGTYLRHRAAGWRASPVPALRCTAPACWLPEEMAMIPGELMPADGEIELNAGRSTVSVTVANTGDRPIQVGSHFHFYETNTALSFDREAARGFRLNIAAGTAVRFEPGQTRTVELVALDGDRIVYGFNGKIMGAL